MRRLQSLLAGLPGGELHHHGQNRNRPPRRKLGPKDRRMSGVPLPIEKVFSPQRRRGAEISAEKTSGIRLRLVHPSEARTPQFEVARALCCLSSWFSALISAPLRLCGESNPRSE